MPLDDILNLCQFIKYELWFFTWRSSWGGPARLFCKGLNDSWRHGQQLQMFEPLLHVIHRSNFSAAFQSQLSNNFNIPEGCFYRDIILNSCHYMFQVHEVFTVVFQLKTKTIRLACLFSFSFAICMHCIQSHPPLSKDLSHSFVQKVGRRAACGWNRNVPRTFHGGSHE